MTEINDVSEAPSLPTFDQIHKQIEENKRVEAEAFQPTEVLELLMLRVLGCWEHVVEDVRFFKYVVGEDPDAVVFPDAENVAKDMRRIARKLNLRLPEGYWTKECDEVRQIRNDLGHMLHIVSIEGEAPHRSVTFRRVPYRQPDEMTMDQNWAKHRRITVTQTEQQLIQAIHTLRWLKESVFALRKFGMEFSHWPNEKPLDITISLLQWWLPEWGEPGSRELLMRDVRVEGTIPRPLT
ncbi:hypothetical protein [Nocardia abscessus]|uniref:hypothetical protein n=1 Tax=Nocardia abscessus TaxID=120957 RepID=UPI0024578B2D|nr:hypothetical protein [Nocardia abscessus]